MRVSHCWYALLVLGYAHTTYAEEIAKDTTSNDTTALEIIEMLGELDDEITILGIAMSDVNLNEKSAAQEVKNVD